MKWLKIALGCAVVPLITGIMIFLLWLSTGWGWLMLVGLFTLLGGGLLFMAGFAALLVFVRHARSIGVPYKRTFYRALGMLLLNFPVAAAILGYVGYIIFGHFVTVANFSTHPVEVKLTDPVFSAPRTLTFGTVAPGEDETKRLTFKGEGTVNYTVTLNGKTESGMLIGYVTGGDGGKVTLIIQPDDTITVVEGRD